MASIKTTLSAIEGFTSKNSASYTAVLEIANDLLSRAERLHIEVRADGETIENQIYRVKMVLDEASQKAYRYQHEANEAAGDAERTQREIEYIIDNPKKRTETDDDGNETTVEEIDYEALSVAQRKKEDAEARYYYAKGKYQESAQIVADAQATISKFESMAQAVTYVANSIESTTYEIKKYIRMIEEEAEYNIQTLYSLIDKINNYLSSKPIFHPSGISSGDYSRGSASGGGYSGGGASGGSFVSKATGDNSIDVSDFVNVNTPLSVALLDDLPIETSEDLPLVSYGRTKAHKDFKENKYLRFSEAFASQATLNERKAALNYSKEAYKKMNSFLRGKNPEFISVSEETRTKNEINTITQTIDRCNLPGDMLLYRGLSNPEPFFKKGYESKSLSELRAELVGREHTEHAFCSTSIREEAAAEFAKTWEGTMVIIRAPKGANAICMGTDSTSNMKNEKEVLLQRSSVLRITNIEADRSGKYKYIVYADLVGRRTIENV